MKLGKRYTSTCYPVSSRGRVIAVVVVERRKRGFGTDWFGGQVWFCSCGSSGSDLGPGKPCHHGEFVRDALQAGTTPTTGADVRQEGEQA